MPNKHGYQHRGMSKPSASLQKQSSHLSSSSKSRIRQFNLFHRAKKNMENTNCCESEEEEDEFEFEAEEAFRIVTKGTEDKADEFDNDEFDEAFESFKVKEIDAVKVNQSAEVEKLTSSTSKSKKESSGNSGTGSKSCERKEVKVQISEVKENEIPKENESHAHGDRPPLPEFALDLITRQKSLKEEPLSPSHSVLSAHSNESSERGWSSDPEPYRQKSKKSLNEVKEEWDHVGTVTAGAGKGLAKSPMVSFTEATFHFKNSNMDEFSASIKPTIRHKGLARLWHVIAGPPKLHKRLKKDRDLIFTLGLCPFDNHEAMHIMILQTIYKKLTATNLDCPRYGSHWESIGFQGEDPSTDLRGCGMLGLLTTLNFVTSLFTSSLAIDIYRLSEDEVQNFPFSVMGINITRITLQIFREGKLNKECNTRGQVFEVFNELFNAIYYTLYRIWKTQCKTISDSGFVIAEVESQAKDKPAHLMTTFRKAMNDRKKGKAPVDIEPATKDKGAPIEKVEKFVGLCDLGNKGEEDVHLV